ncbi:MAG: endonuclease V [Fibrobacteres bacterium]|nr:endonuclease V [Fibrobacterota bacterium]
MGFYRPPLDPAFAPLMEEWRAHQLELASRIAERPLTGVPRLIAGADSALSPDKGWILSAVVVWDREEKRVVEIAHGAAPARYPYIPGYLSFREAPALEAAFKEVKSPFGLVLFDGMGKAHPRRCGIAAHMGVTLGIPAVGVGKSRLYGFHREVGPDPGDREPLKDKGEILGMVLRTKVRVKPVYVSVGNLCDLDSAMRAVEACLAGYRLPEPTRLADKEAARFKLEWKEPAIPREMPAG